MNKTLILTLFLMLFILGCNINQTNNPEIIDFNVKKHQNISSMILNMDDLSGNWSMIKDYSKTFSKLQKSDQDFQKNIGFRGGHVRKYRSYENDLYIFQSISIYNDSEGARKYIEENKDNIKQYNRPSLNLSLGDNSISYILIQEGNVKYKKYYKLKFIKDNVYMHIYVSMPGEDIPDLTSELQKYADIIYSKLE